MTNTPFYYLTRHRITQRPRPCRRCGQNAYYYHDDWDYVCAAHLLDLVNIGGLAFDWEDYPEVWQRTERLLQRKPLSSTIAKTMELPTEMSAADQENLLDGLNEEMWDD